MQHISAQQAAYLFLSFPLHTATRDFFYINTSLAEEKTLLLHWRTQLEKMDPTRINILFDDIIAKYIKWKPSLHKICLATFPSQHTIPATQKTQRKKGKIIRFKTYNKSKDPEQYYRELCLLYLPFESSEDSLNDDYPTWHDMYNHHKGSIEANRQLYNKMSPYSTTSTTKSSSTNTNSNRSYEGFDLAKEMNTQTKHIQANFTTKNGYTTRCQTTLSMKTFDRWTLSNALSLRT